MTATRNRRRFRSRPPEVIQKPDGFEECLRIGGEFAFEDGLASFVEDVGEHAPGVEIDTA